MKIELNQIFSTEEDEHFTQWKILTKGRHNFPLNRFKGMPYFSQIEGRTPVINFHSNPFKEDEEQTITYALKECIPKRWIKQPEC